MGEPAGVQIITPPNRIKERLGNALPKFDGAAIERAERALQSLSGQFDLWMDEELAKLEAVWAEAKTEGLAGAAGDRLYLSAHDVKGLGSTYNFPLVTRLAASLCRLIETPQLRARAHPVLVSGLINGIRIAIRDRIRTEEHPTGTALAEESETIIGHMLRSQGA
jgi:hypothetical protein